MFFMMGALLAFSFAFSEIFSFAADSTFGGDSWTRYRSAVCYRAVAILGYVQFPDTFTLLICNVAVGVTSSFDSVQLFYCVLVDC